MTESPSQFSFQCEQNSPLQKNIETQDAMNKVFEMYFNNKQSPNFNTIIQEEQQELEENNKENVLGDITNVSTNQQQSSQKEDSTDHIKVYEKGIGKMKELGETIKKSMSQIHIKCNETKESLQNISNSYKKQHIGKNLNENFKDSQDNTNNIQKNNGLNIDFDSLWDNQLNKCFHDFMNTAQDALLKATTPGKIQPTIQKKGVTAQNVLQQKQVQVKQAPKTIQQQPLQKKKPQSAQKFANSSIQIGQQNKDQVQVKRKPGSAMRFSTGSIQVKKPGSTSKFFPLQQQKAKVSGVQQQQTNINQQKGGIVGKGSVQKLGIINKSKDIAKRSVGRFGKESVAKKPIKPVFK